MPRKTHAEVLAEAAECVRDAARWLLWANWESRQHLAEARFALTLRKQGRAEGLLSAIGKDTRVGPAVFEMAEDPVFQAEAAAAARLSNVRREQDGDPPFLLDEDVPPTTT